MSTITITFDVPDIDPTLVDPHEVADSVIDAYNDWAQANDAIQVAQSHMSAEWDNDG